MVHTLTDSLHFILVLSASSIENAREIATKELIRFGNKKRGCPDWFLIGSISRSDARERLLIAKDKHRWTIRRANIQVNTWLKGKFTDHINALVDSIDHGKVQISELKMEDLKRITRYYDSRIASNRFRKEYDKEPFDMMKGHEFNAGVYDDFGVTQIVNSFDGDKNYVVAVYCDIK